MGKAQEFGIWKGAEGGPDLRSRRTGKCEDLGSAFSILIAPVKDSRFADKSKYGMGFAFTFDNCSTSFFP